MKYILNFDNNKIKELNLKGMKEFTVKVEERALRAEKTTDLEIKKKIKSEKIDKHVLDTDDLLILRFIYSIGNEPTSVRLEEDNSFFWVKYDALFEEYEGLLFFSKTALNVRLNKYEYMKLIERKCVRNEDGTFSFFKLTGINDLIYIPADVKKVKSVKPVDSNGNTPIDGQTHIDDLMEDKNVEDKTDVERIIYVTGCSRERAEEVLSYAIACDKNNPVGFSIKAIQGNWELKNKETNGINPRSFNNFKAREYDYDDLEKKMLGWDKEVQEDISPKKYNDLMKEIMSKTE